MTNLGGKKSKKSLVINKFGSFATYHFMLKLNQKIWWIFDDNIWEFQIGSTVVNNWLLQVYYIVELLVIVKIKVNIIKKKFLKNFFSSYVEKVLFSKQLEPMKICKILKFIRLSYNWQIKISNFDFKIRRIYVGVFIGKFTCCVNIIVSFSGNFS